VSCSYACASIKAVAFNTHTDPHARIQPTHTVRRAL